MGKRGCIHRPVLPRVMRLGREEEEEADAGKEDEEEEEELEECGTEENEEGGRGSGLQLLF